MSTNSKKGFLIFVVLITIVSACSKYEDGPKLSLLSKNKRISRAWKIEYSINIATQIEHSADYTGWLLSFNSEGSYTQTIIYNQSTTTINGSWVLVGDTQLRLSFNTGAGEQIEFYTILRLTKRELWLKGEFEEIHYYTD